jgi:hypothetical protein
MQKLFKTYCEDLQATVSLYWSIIKTLSENPEGSAL